jgi:hypothetical protein
MGSRNQVIANIEQSGGLRFGYVGDNMVFQDTLPRRAAPRRR